MLSQRYDRMVSFMKTRFISLLLMLATPAGAAEWTATEIQGLYGQAFREPGPPADVAKSTVTLTNASGFAWGSTYFFVDHLQSNARDANARETYGELYVSPSLGKLTGHDFRTGPLKDVSLTFGVNAGSKNTGADPLVWLPGVSFNLDVPGFAFFDVSVLGYLDHGKQNGAANGCNANIWQITPAWKRPFRLGRLSMSFEGFVDVIGAHGNCVQQVITQPQLRVDVGDWFGHPGRVHAGIEYQYWRNKYGIQGLHENLPQALLVWGF